MNRLIFVLCTVFVLFACGKEPASDKEQGSAAGQNGMGQANQSEGGIKTLPAGQSIQLIYSSNLNGELEPCGCTIDTDYGGLARRATAVEQLKQTNPNLVLISGGGLLDALSPNDKIKGQFIMEGMSMLPYDAIGIQWVDFTFGDELLKQFPLPMSSFNYPESTFPSQKEIVRGALTIQFYSLLDPLHYGLMGGEKAFLAQSENIITSLKQAKEQGKLTILSTQANIEWLELNKILEYVDVLVSPGRDEFFISPTQEKHTIVLTPGNRGMRLGELNLTTDSKGALQIQSHKVIELDDKVVDAPSMQDWYDRYNDGVRVHFQQLNEKKKALEAGESQFVGVDTCQTCHQEAYRIWKETRHSGALSTLEAVDKHYDPNCLKCHVLGLHENDGFIDLDTTPQFANVQCENCHGPGRAHSTNPVANDMNLPNPEKQGDNLVCFTCHNKHHSPKFNFDQYWPKIKH